MYSLKDSQIFIQKGAMKLTFTHIVFMILLFRGIIVTRKVGCRDQKG